MIKDENTKKIKDILKIIKLMIDDTSQAQPSNAYSHSNYSNYHDNYDHDDKMNNMIMMIMMIK